MIDLKETEPQVNIASDGVSSFPSVAENVSKKMSFGNNSNPSKNQKNTKGFFGNLSVFSDLIKDLVKVKVEKKIEKVELPSFQKQKSIIKKTLQKEEQNLLKNSRKTLSAHALEKIISRIRYIRQTLSELINAGIKNIEEFYKRFVLKVS